MWGVLPGHSQTWNSINWGRIYLASRRALSLGLQQRLSAEPGLGTGHRSEQAESEAEGERKGNELRIGSAQGPLTAQESEAETPGPHELSLSLGAVICLRQFQFHLKLALVCTPRVHGEGRGPSAPWLPQGAALVGDLPRLWLWLCWAVGEGRGTEGAACSQLPAAAAPQWSLSVPAAWGSLLVRGEHSLRRGTAGCLLPDWRRGWFALSSSAWGSLTQRDLGGFSSQHQIGSP